MKSVMSVEEPFCDMNQMNKHLKETKHKSSTPDENLDISLDEERLMRLQKDMEVSEAVGGFTN